MVLGACHADGQTAPPDAAEPDAEAPLPPLCDPGYLDCNGDPADGCEVGGDFDPSNCGGCRQSCLQGLKPGEVGTCVAGKCQLACRTGWADCDQDPDNGCEASLGSDPRNCNGCGIACSDPFPFCATHGCAKNPNSCLAYLQAGFHQSGVYTLGNQGATHQVYCDMEMDGGGWVLEMVRRIDDAYPDAFGKSRTWACLPFGPTVDFPLSPTLEADGFWGAGEQDGLQRGDGLLMAGRRILKLYYSLPGRTTVAGVNAFVKGRCAGATDATADAPVMGQLRSGCGYLDDPCTTTDIEVFRRHDPSCPHDAASAQSDPAYCQDARCGAWGNCPGPMSTEPPQPTPRCWYYGGQNAVQVPKLSDCPPEARAPWAHYETGTLAGFYTFWSR